MNVVFSERQKAHFPKRFLSSGAPQPNPEVPERAERLLEAALESGLTHVPPDDFGLAPVAAVHSAEYLHFLEHIHERWRRIQIGRAHV